MNLLETFDSLLQEWRPIFSQKRTFQRARRLTLGLLVCLRLHLTSRAICATGRQFVDWSADYRLCACRVWNPQRLFDPLFDHLPALLPAPGAPVIAALDDTLCKKTGRHIPGVSMARDPMSPAFRVNLCYGLRFVQVSLLVSPVASPGAARALPVRFDLAPPAAKPKKNAAAEIREAYKKEKKLRALPLAGLAAIASVRQSLDERPETAQRQLIVSGDGSYTNKTVLRHLPPRTTFIGRIRKDAKLHLPLPEREGDLTLLPSRGGSRLFAGALGFLGGCVGFCGRRGGSGSRIGQQNGRAVAFQRRLANALDLAQVIDTLERAIGITPGHDGICFRLTDTVERLGDGGGVGLIHVDRRTGEG